jgi:hypothetical protein
MAETFLNMPFVREVILPFILVFAIAFAVLQKSEILGKDKKQVDAIVALVVGLLVITVGKAVGVIVNLVPILAVGLVVILAFLLLWGMAYKGGDDAFKVPGGVKSVIGGLAAIAVIGAVLYYTGAWDYLKNAYLSGTDWVTNVVVVIVVIIAVAVVLWAGGSGKKE